MLLTTFKKCKSRPILFSIFDGRLVRWSEVQTTKPEVPSSNPGSGRSFCDEQLHLLSSHGCLFELLSIYPIYISCGVRDKIKE
jgi:hypothetical protein